MEPSQPSLFFDLIPLPLGVFWFQNNPTPIYRSSRDGCFGQPQRDPNEEHQVTELCESWRCPRELSDKDEMPSHNKGEEEWRSVIDIVLEEVAALTSIATLTLSIRKTKFPSLVGLNMKALQNMTLCASIKSPNGFTVPCYKIPLSPVPRLRNNPLEGLLIWLRTKTTSTGSRFLDVWLPGRDQKPWTAA